MGTAGLRATGPCHARRGPAPGPPCNSPAHPQQPAVLLWPPGVETSVLRERLRVGKRGRNQSEFAAFASSIREIAKRSRVLGVIAATTCACREPGPFPMARPHKLSPRQRGQSRTWHARGPQKCLPSPFSGMKGFSEVRGGAGCWARRCCWSPRAVLARGQQENDLGHLHAQSK